MNKGYQIIEDGYNSSYIISTIMSLFFRTSEIDRVLDVDPDDPKFIYIQEFIKTRFVEPIKRGYSIHMDVINELRNYMAKCDWHNDVDTMLLDHNVIDFFNYFVGKVYGKNEIIFNRLENSKKINELALNIIELKPPAGISKMTLNELFKVWLNGNVMLEKYNYTLESVPVLLPMHIDREDSDIMIDINYKTKLFGTSNSLEGEIEWVIHSLICKDDTGNYSVVRSGKRWLKITDKTVPSISQIDMDDIDDVKKISKEVVMVFYKRINN
jgi:hypothetical protein